MKSYPLLLLTSLLGLFFTACAPLSAPATEPSTPLMPSTPSPAPTEPIIIETAVVATTTPVPLITPTELMVDIFIDPASTFEPVVMLVGQTFAVQPPFSAEWNVDYHPSYLRALIPADTLYNPGPQGWVSKLKARAKVKFVFPVAQPVQTIRNARQWRQNL